MKKGLPQQASPNQKELNQTKNQCVAGEIISSFNLNYMNSIFLNHY